MNYLLFLQSLRESCPDFINSIFLVISEAIVNGGFVIPLIIYWCIDKVAGAEIIMGYTTSSLLNQSVKNICCVYRPWIKESRLYVYPKAASSATGYSFPSGHTSAATAIYGGAAKYCHSKKRRVISTLLIILTLLTAFSRNWLGAHTLQDVVVALVLTAAVIAIISIVKKWVDKKPSRDTAVTLVMIIVSFAVTIYLSVKKYPMDYLPDGTLLVDPFAMITDCYTSLGVTVGGFLGWWIERHYINFSTDGTVPKKILRFVIGGAIEGLIIAFGTKAFSFLGAHWCHFVKYFLLLIIGTAGYPAIFKQFQKK